MSLRRPRSVTVMRASLAAVLALVVLTGTAASANASEGDADGDRIPDAVEVAVCGTATCATGLEDRDGDGPSTKRGESTAPGFDTA